MSRQTFIAGAVRTPIGKFGGTFVDISAVELGAVAARGAIEASGLDPAVVDGLIFGQARQAGAGPNPARQVGKKSGLADSVPAYTINRACGSGMQTIISARHEILLGEAEVVLVGGMESMSNTPFMLPKARWGYRMGHGELVDGMYRDGFMCPLSNILMGETAENLADQYAISRQEQDEYAVLSQRRCENARKDDRFRAEKVPVPLVGKKSTTLFWDDEHARDGVTLESTAKLPPVFRPQGTVHAGNSSGITDGASAMVVLSGEALASHGLTPLGRIVDSAIVGVAPETMGIGPVPAIRKLLQRTGLSLEDIDLFEINEAFAAQLIACVRELRIPMERLNVNGGSIALGHPIGATGSRVVVTLLHEMHRRGVRRGIASLCISGGMGIAVLLENPEYSGS